MKRLCILISLILAAGFILLYNNQSSDYVEPVKSYTEDTNYPVTIDTFDSNGKPVQMVFLSKPQRVVTDELNTFETLLALGLGDRIVQCSVSPNSQTYRRLEQEYPEELKKVHGLSIHDLNTESVLANAPDFILGWKSTFTSQLRKATSWWNERGVNTYVVATSNHVMDSGTIENECQFLADMGKIFDVEDKTIQKIEEIHNEIVQTREQTKDREKQFTMVIEMSGRAFMNYDSGWLIGDMVTELGGDMPVKEKRIGYEDLIAYDPDVIFVVYFNENQKGMIRNLFSEAKFSSLKVVKNNRIYLLPFDHMYTTAIKTAEGIRMVKHGLYPDLP